MTNQIKKLKNDKKLLLFEIQTINMTIYAQYKDDEKEQDQDQPTVPHHSDDIDIPPCMCKLFIFILKE